MPGPGEYLPDATEGITRVKEFAKTEGHPTQPRLPTTAVPDLWAQFLSGSSGTTGVARSWGFLRSSRPHDMHLTYSVHHCTECDKYFNADMSDLALPGTHYTHRVVALAVRLVVEDGLPYQAASWHLWRDHRVFVPFATIQNWVEAGGKKGGGPHRRRLPRLGTRRVLRVHRGRRVVRRAVLRAVDRR